MENSKAYITGSTRKPAILLEQKTDLIDVTFLVPLRIDSSERKENTDTLIKYTFRNFNTSFIVLEADATRKFYPEKEPEGFRHEFIEDTNEVFHRTKWINRLISMSQTPYVAVGDTDAIAPPERVIESVGKFRKGGAVRSFQ